MTCYVNIQEVRSASYTKHEVNLTSYHIEHDMNGTEKEYFLKDFTPSSEWEVLNIHKVQTGTQKISLAYS